MSKNFELMNKLECDSLGVRLGRAARATVLNPPNLQQPAGAPDGILAADLWSIIRHRKWTITAFALVVVGMVMAASFAMKPKYDAVARMMVVFHRDNDSGVLGFKGVDTSLLEDPEDRAAIDTQIGILQTDALALQVIKDLHLDKNPKFGRRPKQAGNEDGLVKLFHNSLAITKVKGTRLIDIRFRSTDPRLAADVVNDLAKAYLDQYYRSQFQVSTQISDFLATQVKELHAKVEESQRKLDEFQKQNGILDLDDKQNIATARLGDLNKDLTAAESDRVQKEFNYRLARSAQPELFAKLEPDSLLTRLRTQQADLENQIAQASVQLGPEHPRMTELSKQLAQVRQSIDAEQKRISEHIAYEYQGAVARERMLREALESQKRVAGKLNASVLQAQTLKHEFESNRNLYDNLLQKQKEVGITASLKSSNIWIVDPARPPKQPVEPKILRNFAIALGAGLFGGVLLALGLARINEKTICTVEQAQFLSSLPALGVLPLLEAKSKNSSQRQLAGVNGPVDPALVSLLQPMSPAAESYRAALTALLLSQSPFPGVIQVTSALPGEGKTTVSTNLAVLLSRLSRRVLLVDADLRRPRVHVALRLSPSIGLGALLRNSVPFEEAVISYAEVPNLFILPAGPVILPDDTELLVSGFKDLLERWREQFDHIIIDTPPVLPVADAVRMSVEADSVVLVIRSGQITREPFLRAQDSLLKVNAHLAGFVLNGAQLDSPDFRYYRSYYGEGQTRRLGKGT